MAKTKETTMWALWNFRRIMGVEPTRKRCYEYANQLIVGGKKAADEMFKSGALRVTKVAVREL